MKKRLTGYTFDASAQTVVHADFSDIGLEGISAIINVTDQVVIYNLADTGKGGTLSTDTLTLEFDTTTMDDTDKLAIYVDDAVVTQPVSVASLPLPSGAATAANQATIISHVDGIEGALATVVAAIYADGANDPVPEGHVIMWRNSVNDDILAVADNAPLPVEDSTAQTSLATIETSNASIDTSTAGILVDTTSIATIVAGLALESGGNLAALAAAVKAEDAVHASGDSGFPMWAVRKDSAAALATTDGDYAPFEVDSTGRLHVRLTQSNIGEVSVSGGAVAHGSADSGNPIKIGFKAKSPDGTSPGVVAENDRTDAYSDLNGRQFVNTRSPQWWSFHSDGSSALTDQVVQADPGDGFEIVITEITFSTGAATACNIFFEEGATKILGPWYLEAVAGRGIVWRGEKHVTASTAVTVTTSAAIAQSLDVQGYIQAV